jgi:hypothetical protein
MKKVETYSELNKRHQELIKKIRSLKQDSSEYNKLSAKASEIFEKLSSIERPIIGKANTSGNYKNNSLHSH